MPARTIQVVGHEIDHAFVHEPVQLGPHEQGLFLGFDRIRHIRVHVVREALGIHALAQHALDRVAIARVGDHDALEIPVHERDVVVPFEAFVGQDLYRTGTHEYLEGVEVFGIETAGVADEIVALQPVADAAGIR